MLKRIFIPILLTVSLIIGSASIVNADFTINASETFTLTANETFTIDGTLTISATGALDASASTTNISLSGSWSNSGTFTPGTSSTVTFTDNSTTSTITGNNTFYNLTCETASKQLTLGASSTQTISNTLTLNGGASGTKIALRSSTTGTRWIFDVTAAAQSVSYVDVKDSNASSNNIVATNSTNSGNNDNTESPPHWVFDASATISSPTTGKTVGRQPTIIGTSGPSDTVQILGLVSASSTVVATVTADSSGNFRVMQSDFTESLDTDANSLTPRVSGISGSAVSITVVASPTTDQVPSITSPSDGGSVRGATPTITGQGLASQTVTLYAKDANGNLLLSSIASSTVNASGSYTISSSDYTTSIPKGTVYLSVQVNGVNSNITTATFVDPFGVVFDSVSNDAIKGATVTLYYDNDSGAGRDWIQAVAGTHIAATDTNPQTTGSDGLYSYNCINGDFYISISASGYNYPSVKTSFPSGRTIITGSKGEPFTVSSAVIEMDHPMDANAALLRIEKDANKKEVSIGDIITYTVTIENITSDDVASVYLEDNIPPGFKYINAKAILDNVAISDPSGNRPLSFNIGTVSASQRRTLKYQLVVGAGVTFGNYENRAFAKYSNGTVISNVATETVKVIPDPLFDLGEVMGKVFHDRNENGIQDPPEKIDGQIITEEPIPNAQIVTEEGTVITTDKDGKYHLAGIIPGRHLFRLDERGLPNGAYLTTDKVVVVDITQGILAKVNFGVKLPDGVDIKELPFQVIQERDKPKPRLNVALFSPLDRETYLTGFNDELTVKDGYLEQNAEFRIFTNYNLFINKWELEILDKDTKQLIKKFQGTRNNIFEPIYWDTKDKRGELIRTDRNYVYLLTVTGAGSKKDATKEKDIKISIYNSELRTKEQEKIDKEKEEEYKKWLIQESKKNNLDRQTIKIEGDTVKVKGFSYVGSSKSQGSSIREISAQGLSSQTRGVRIIKSGELQTEIPILETEDLKARELLDSSFKAIDSSEMQNEVEIILPKGDYKIEIETVEKVNGLILNEVKDLKIINREFTLRSLADARDESVEKPFQHSQIQNPSLIGGQANIEDQNKEEAETYTQNIRVGEDYLFFVAMGDAKTGYTFNWGNVEPVQQDDKFKEGFWAEGKLAYYLKGKIKGKYLITSSFDSQRDKKELFKNLDPDKYYPIYGDESSINYSATNTQGPLYLLIEWDKSSAIWGNYNTAFTDTEFAQFTRTLYGAKVHLESVSTTKFGQPHTRLITFRARAQQKAAHNEFVGTGGSLFYLKHKDIIEGSDKIKIEVRDKITGLVLTVLEMKKGVDYEIDYSNGRIVFWRAISRIAESDSIISSHILSGNPIYVVADYEYEVKDKYDEGTSGARLEQSLSDYLVVGGTYVKEEQQKKDYELKATDATVHLGKDIELIAEYAESESEATGGFISTDGGLSFTELPTDEYSKGEAYGIKGQAHLFNRLGLSSYYKWIENNFSSSDTSSQQGKELIGLAATYDIASKTRLKLSHDIQKLIDNGNLQTQLQVGAAKTETSSAQISHDMDKLKFTTEYRHQKVSEKKEQFESETNTQEDTIAAKADYKLTDRIDVSLRQQATLKGTPNHQTSAGIITKVSDGLTLRAEQTVGTKGAATSVGATSNVTDKFEMTADYTRTNEKAGKVSDSASLGATAKLDDKTKVHSSYAVTDSMSENKTQSISFGSERKINDELKFTKDITLASAKDNIAYSSNYGLAREKDGKKLETTFGQEHSEKPSEVSNANIFGLSGDINDRWAAQGSFERGVVQNHNGTQAKRNAGSFSVGFVDKDKKTGRVNLKASSKVELRLDEGGEDKRQYVLHNAIEGKINSNTTLFAKANLSQTKNTTTNSTEAQYKELTLGAAYRPVTFDWLNILTKYTYLEDSSPSSQIDINDIGKEKAHILAGEAIIDLTNKWQLSQKLAYKMAEEQVTGFEFTKTQTWLWINRLNYNIDRDWQVSAEYRILTQEQAKDQKQGALLEISRNIGEFIQMGIGYNFTDFNDDLTNLDYTAQGPFLRMSGKWFDRTPEEIERIQKEWIETRIRHWAWELVNNELASRDSRIIKELNNYFYLAKRLQDEDRLDEAKQLYIKIANIADMMYSEAEEYIRGRIELEKKLKEYNQLALEYYKQEKFEEAKKMWQKMIIEAQPQPISLEFNDG